MRQPKVHIVQILQEAISQKDKYSGIKLLEYNKKFIKRQREKKNE